MSLKISPRRFSSRLALRGAELTAYAAMGPLTGPLVAGVVRNLKKRQPVLASLYALAAVLVWIELAAAGAWAADFWAKALT